MRYRNETKQQTSLEQRIKELEKIAVQKQIKIDFLEEMINVAKEVLNIDIKKKSFTSQSTDSETGKKA